MDNTLLYIRGELQLYKKRELRLRIRERDYDKGTGLRWKKGEAAKEKTSQEGARKNLHEKNKEKIASSVNML